MYDARTVAKEIDAGYISALLYSLTKSTYISLKTNAKTPTTIIIMKLYFGILSTLFVHGGGKILDVAEPKCAETKQVIDAWILKPDQEVLSGHSLYSPSAKGHGEGKSPCEVKIEDGNAIIYNNGIASWTTDVSGGSFLTLQNGNLVLMSSNKQSKWSSSTSTGNFAMVRDAGGTCALEVYDERCERVWTSHPAPECENRVLVEGSSRGCVGNKGKEVSVTTYCPYGYTPVPSTLECRCEDRKNASRFSSHQGGDKYSSYTLVDGVQQRMIGKVCECEKRKCCSQRCISPKAKMYCDRNEPCPVDRAGSLYAGNSKLHWKWLHTCTRPTNLAGVLTCDYTYTKGFATSSGIESSTTKVTESSFTLGASVTIGAEATVLYAEATVSAEWSTTTGTETSHATLSGKEIYEEQSYSNIYEFGGIDDGTGQTQVHMFQLCADILGGELCYPSFHTSHSKTPPSVAEDSFLEVSFEVMP